VDITFVDVAKKLGEQWKVNLTSLKTEGIGQIPPTFSDGFNHAAIT
jgi:hypothetical protein